MFKTKYLILVLILLCPIISIASDFQITRFQLRVDDRTRSNQLSALISLKWKNSWNNAKNHDAVWVFIKVGTLGRGNRHALILPNNYQILSSNVKNLKIDVPKDQAGFFIYPGQKYRGDVECTLVVKLDKKALKRLNIYSIRGQAYGLEMVYVPEGGYTLGDPDATAYKNFSAFYKSDAEGKYDGLYKITAENQVVEVGPEKGKLYYQVKRAIYQGDQKGPVPAEFPKGVQSFYVMKYEVTQGQYVNFLNSLRDGQTQFRVPFGVKGYYKYRGSIVLKKDKYYAKSPQRPCNYIGWDDGCAFADWAGLRPWTELEYTKACRGPQKPVAHEFPWNTNSRNKVLRVVAENDELVLLDGLDESKLTDQNRDQFGASYYWVMDLAGSVWERVITIGDPVGRQFKGTHGDGNLTGYGYATNKDWPSGDTEKGGFGFRGGGYYEHGISMSDFNPYSPIAYRPYGSWSGGNRSKAYSNRFARTAEKK
ncbi:hypothetical protein BKI52_32150 [marine bacterium AO1-C]|nr:hypothetical protein BKI52_32150 [marine bacterium AO1-C]